MIQSRYLTVLIKTTALTVLVLAASFCRAQTTVQVDSVVAVEDEEVFDGEQVDTFTMPDTADYNAESVDAPRVRTIAAQRWFLDDGEAKKSYDRRRIDAQQRASVKSDEDYWYADYDFSENKKKEEKKDGGNGVWDLSFLRTPFAQVILWMLIIGGFAAVLAIYLRNNSINLFRSSKKIAEPITGDAATEDIFSIDYEKELSAASGRGDYRLAIRLLFLRLLRQMTDRNIIQYAHDRTNMDYLMQLASGQYYKSFFHLARAYEYAWYGKFPVDGSGYTALLHDFNEMSKSVTGH